MTVYISLPISGHPMEEVLLRADYAKRRLRAHGHEPVSPLDPSVNNDHTKPYNVLLGNDIAALLQCEAVLFLDGWMTSRGCRLEMEAAQIYGKKIYFEYDLRLNRL